MSRDTCYPSKNMFMAFRKLVLTLVNSIAEELLESPVAPLRETMKATNIQWCSVDKEASPDG